MAKKNQADARPKLGRPNKWGFFLSLNVGKKHVVSTEGMTTAERYRLLRVLRSRKSQLRKEGRDFDIQPTKAGIQVERLA